MFGVIGLWFKVAYEFADFAYSAILHYANTPEGAADWNEVTTALESVGLIDIPGSQGAPTDEASEQAAANGWGGIGQVRNAQEGEEKAPHERLAASSRIVNRPPNISTAGGGD